MRIVQHGVEKCPYDTLQKGVTMHAAPHMRAWAAAAWEGCRHATSTHSVPESISGLSPSRHDGARAAAAAARSRVAACSSDSHGRGRARFRCRYAERHAHLDVRLTMCARQGGRASAPLDKCSDVDSVLRVQSAFSNFSYCVFDNLVPVTYCEVRTHDSTDTAATRNDDNDSNHTTTIR